MKPQQKSIQANYDRLSRWYDALSGKHEAQVRARALELLDPQPGEHVLEVGAGTGQSFSDLLRAVGDQGFLTGLDLSWGMLSAAKTRAGNRIGLVQADAANLPMLSTSYSALLACFTLEIFPADELPAVLAEWRRVLRPGGRLCVAAMSYSARPGWMERLYVWSGRAFPQVVDCRPIDAAGVTAEAGFSVQRVERVVIWGLPVQIVLACV